MEPKDTIVIEVSLYNNTCNGKNLIEVRHKNLNLALFFLSNDLDLNDLVKYNY